MFLRLKTDYSQVWVIEKVTYAFPLQEKKELLEIKSFMLLIR